MQKLFILEYTQGFCEVVYNRVPGMTCVHQAVRWFCSLKKNIPGENRENKTSNAVLSLDERWDGVNHYLCLDYVLCSSTLVRIWFYVDSQQAEIKV